MSRCRGNNSRPPRGSSGRRRGGRVAGEEGEEGEGEGDMDEGGVERCDVAGLPGSGDLAGGGAPFAASSDRAADSPHPTRSPTPAAAPAARTPRRLTFPALPCSALAAWF